MQSNLLERSPSHWHPLKAGQVRLDAIGSSLVEGASEPRSVAALIAGSLTFQASRLFLSRLASPLLGNAGVFTRALTHTGISGAALGAEVAAFRGVSQAQGAQGFASDYLSFGTLKGFGALARGQSTLLAHAFQASGLVASHQVSYGLGLLARPEGNWVEQLAQAEALNMKLGLGMALAGSLSPGFSLLHQNLELEGSCGGALRPLSPAFAQNRILPRWAHVDEPEESLVKFPIALDIEELRLQYGMELKHLAQSDTPFRISARRFLEVLTSNPERDRVPLDVLSEQVEAYERERALLQAALVESHRRALPRMGRLINDILRSDQEGRMVEVHTGSKDAEKIVPKLLDRKWSSMEPFTDIIRGKIILRSPIHAWWVEEQVLARLGEDVKIREMRDGDGNLMGQPDFEPLVRLLDGYYRGTHHFALRRVKIVFDVRGEDGVFYPFELQLLSRWFNQWGEIQRRLVKDNKTSHPQEWKALDDYCNEAAEWLSARERGLPSASSPPKFDNGGIYWMLTPSQRADLAAMEVLLEKALHEIKIGEDPI